MSEISLTASMRSNLLSLQQIAKLQDSTQLRLSTGLKVNSAIDNPSSYYTASSLTNRAEDLSALLDSMGQSVQSIKAATEGIEKAEDLLSQMKAIAEQVNTGTYVPEKSYFEKLVGSNGAVVSTKEELKAAIDSGKEEICVYGKIDLGDISTSGGLSLQANQKLVGVNYYGNFGTEGEEFSSISATATVAGKDLVKITKANCLVSDLSLNYENSGNTTGTAVIHTSGTQTSATIRNINIKAAFSEKSSIYIMSGISASASTQIGGRINIEATGLRGCGIVSYTSDCEIATDANVNIKTSGIDAKGLWVYINSNCNINSGAKINIEAEKSDGIQVERGTLNIAENANVNIEKGGIHLYNDSSCNIAGELAIHAQTGFYNNGSVSSNSINITSTAQIYFSGNTFAANGKDSGAGPNILDIAQGAKIAIEKDGNTKWYEVKAGYHNETSSTGTSITADNFETTLNVSETNSWKTAEEIIAEQEEKDKKEKEENTTLLNEDEVASYQKQYNNALSQYDSLIKDSSYKGVNLLQADDLKVIFNENRSSTLEVSGVDLSSDKIGMMTADWTKAKDVQNSINQVIEAKNTLRSASTKLGNYYSIITERETFTDNLINVLEEGADKLTLADMNEESANMLSLQTQQQLAINSLSLASQASQAVLRLF